MPNAAPRPTLPNRIAPQLKSLKTRLLAIAVSGGVGLTFTVVAISLAVSLLGDYLLDLPVYVRAGLLFGTLLSGLAAATYWIVRPLVRSASMLELAAVVEDANPELQERLLSAIELSDPSLSGGEAGSPVMREWLMQEVDKSSRNLDFAEAAPAKKALLRCGYGMVAAVSLLLPLLVASDAYGLLLQRFVNPWGNLERSSNLILDVQDAERPVARGADAEIVVTPRWRSGAGKFPETAWLNWEADGASRSVRKRMNWDEARASYVALLPHVVHSFEYNVTAGPARTRTYRREVVEPLAVKTFSIDVDPPGYTGEPAQRYDSGHGEVLAIEQSDLHLLVTVNKPLTSAELIWLDSSGQAGESAAQNAVPLGLSSDRFTARGTERISLQAPRHRFQVRAVDLDGLVVSTVPMRLTILPDRAPLIDFMDLEESAEARPDDIIEMPLAALDDFGLKTVELHYSYLSRLGVRETGIIPIDADQLDVLQWEGIVKLDIARIGLDAGMSLNIRARATDARPVPSPNESWTSDRLIFIKSDAKAYGEKTLQENQKQVQQALQELEQALKEKQQQAEKLQQQAEQAMEQQQAFEKNAELEKLENEIAQIAQQVEKLASHLAQTPLFEGVAQQAMKLNQQQVNPAGQNISQARQPGDAAQKAEQLQQAGKKLEQAAQEVAEMRQQFDKLAEIQKDLLELNRLAAQTERLADGVGRLEDKADQLPEMQGDLQQKAEGQLAREHEQLQQVQQRLEQQLGDLLDRQPELMNAVKHDLAKELNELGALADQLAAKQEELAKAIEEQGQKLTEQLKPVQQAQSQLAEQTEQLLQQASQLPGSEIKPKDAQQALGQQEALKQLEAGNPQTAAEQLAGAVEAMKQLAEALENQARSAPRAGEQQPAVKMPGENVPGKTEEATAGNQPRSEQPQKPQQTGAAEDKGAEKGESPQAAGASPTGDNQPMPAGQPQNPSVGQEKDAGAPPTQDGGKGTEKPDGSPAQDARDPSQPPGDAGKPMNMPPTAEQISGLADQARQLATQQEQLLKQLEERISANADQAPQNIEPGERGQPEMTPKGQDPANQQPAQTQPGTKSEGQESSGTPQKSDPDESAANPPQGAESEGSQQQKQLEQEAKQLAQQFQKAMEKLAEAPVSDPKTAQRAEEARKLTEQAMQSMQTSSKECNCQNPGSASASGKQAASQLQQAASAARGDQKSAGQQGEAQPAQPGQQSSGQNASQGTGAGQGQSQQGQSPDGKSSSPGKTPGTGSEPGEQGPLVPSEVGQQVAKAAEQLTQAGEALSKMRFQGVPGEGDQPGEQGEGSQAESEQGDESPSDQLKQAAQAMRQAAEKAGAGQQQQGQGQGQSQGQGNPSGQGTPGNESSDTGAEGEMAASATDLDLDLEGFTGRNWGELPGTLKSDLLESSRRTSDGDYSRLIRQYFQDISKTRQPDLK